MLKAIKSIFSNNYDILTSACLFIILFLADMVNVLTIYNQTLHNWLMPFGIGFAIIMILRMLTTDK